MDTCLANESQDIFDRGCDTLSLKISQEQRDLLLAYAQLFNKWNKAYNLSAIRDEVGIVRLHLLDSLSIVPLIKGQKVIDVGTGGGLPGIPLAIMYPDRQFTLLDSAGKKMRFLHQVKQTLGLANISIQNCRVESYKPETLYDGVVSRAYASLENMLASCQHLLKENGSFWAMKGQMPHAELSEIEKHYIVVESHNLEVPGVDAQRCLLQIKPIGAN